MVLLLLLMTSACACSCRGDVSSLANEGFFLMNVSNLVCFMPFSFDSLHTPPALFLFSLDDVDGVFCDCFLAVVEGVKFNLLEKDDDDDIMLVMSGVECCFDVNSDTDIRRVFLLNGLTTAVAVLFNARCLSGCSSFDLIPPRLSLLVNSAIKSSSFSSSSRVMVVWVKLLNRTKKN